MRPGPATVALLAFALAVGFGLAGPTALTGCSVNPATGQRTLTAFMSPQDERRIGAEEHPKLVRAFGGLYDDPALRRYVASLGRLLQKTSEQPEPPYRFVILDSPEVNAFALPGGYVHVSRGLVALADDEAELAGVLAHEIGHVTARHAAERYSQGLLAGLGAALLGVGTDSRTVGNIAQLAGSAYVQGYSRSQELEADMLGVRYLSRAGFDPTAMSSFLEAMGAEAALARKIAGQGGADPAASLFASHPRTADRVSAAVEAALARTGGGVRDRNLYLARIDGMTYGDSPGQGFVRGRRFDHPVLRIGFTAPPGFHLWNGDGAVVGRHGSGALMRFDGARLDDHSIATRRYLRDVWAAGTPLAGLETIDVDGLEAVTGITRIDTRSGRRNARLAVIRASADQLYRFLFVTWSGRTDAFESLFRRTIFSFGRLGRREVEALRPLRLRVVEVGPGDTVESLAAGMPFDDFRIERFRVLNGLGPTAHLRPGQMVKLVTE